MIEQSCHGIYFSKLKTPLRRIVILIKKKVVSHTTKYIFFKVNCV